MAARITDANMLAALDGKVLLSADIIKISFGCTNSDYTDQTTCELNAELWTDDILLTTLDRDLQVTVDTGSGPESLTFLATSDLLELPELEEFLEMDLGTFDVSLSAVDNNWITRAQSIEMINRPIWIWRVLLDPDTQAIIGQPFQIFGGSITGGALKVRLDGSGSIVKLDAGNQFYDYERVGAFNCHIESHQNHFPGDTGFKFISTTNVKDVKWM